MTGLRATRDHLVVSVTVHEGVWMKFGVLRIPWLYANVQDVRDGLAAEQRRASRRAAKRDQIALPLEVWE